MKRYPSYIHVACLKDIFWNNNSDLYPTSAPALNLYKRLNKTRPVFHNPYIASVVLTGDYNHAFYGGRYFFLTKLEIIDVEKGIYKYQLDYDVMLNFMSVGSGGRVKGTIVKTNDKEILEKAIQTTVPIIADPTEINVFNPQTAPETEWQKNIISSKSLIDTIKILGQKPFQEPTITVADWTYFVQRVKSNFFAEKTKNKTWLPGTYSTVNYNPQQHTNPLLIFDYLPIKLSSCPWKLEVFGKLVGFLVKQFLWSEKELIKERTQDNTEINKQFEASFYKINKEWRLLTGQQFPKDVLKKFIITKQSKITGHFNDGKYVISLENEAAGDSLQQDVFIEKIDLSGLKDIIPLDLKGNPKEPDITPNLFNHLANTGEEALQVNQFIVRLGRKVYLPINTTHAWDDVRRCIRTQVPEHFDLCSTQLMNNEPPQKIEFKQLFKDRVGSKTGFLWYLDKNNFSLVSYGANEWKALPKGREKTARAPYAELSNAVSTSGWHYWWHFYDHKYKDVLPLGFIMYQLDRDPSYWNGVQYNGNQTLNSLSYINNIKEKAVREFEQNQNNWRVGEFDPNNLLGNNNFLKYWLLELDRMTWLTIIPSYKDLEYKWIQNDEYGIWKYFPNTPQNELKYLARIPHLPITRPDRVLPAPYGRSSITAHVNERYRKLNDITLKGLLTLKYPLKKGDIFTTSLEHELQEVDIEYNLPFDLNQREIVEILNYRYIYDERKKSKYLPAALKPGVTPPSAPVWSYFVPLFGASYLLHQHRIHSEGSINPHSDQIKYSAPVMDSFLHRETLSLPHDFNSLVLYLFDNTWRLGNLTVDKHNYLNLNNDGIIASVEDVRSIQVQTIQISNVDGGVLDYKLNKDDIFNDGVQQTAFQQTIARIRESTNGKIFYYSSEELNTLDTLTFDLVGTDWYLLFAKGTIHLIPKPNTNIIKKKPKTINKINVNIPESIDIYSKINQRADLVVFGQSMPLNIKFSGGRESSLLYETLQLTPTGDDGMEYYNLRALTEADTIDTWITIPSKKTRAIETTDSTQSFVIREKLSNLALEYEQDKVKNRMFLDSKQEMFSRQREDLNWQKQDAIFNIAAKTLQTAGTVAAGGAGLAAGGLAAGAAGGALVGGMAASGAASAASSLYGSVAFLLRYPTLLERVNADERSVILQNTQDLYKRKQNYEHNFAVQTLKLNKGVNTFIKPTISNRDVQEEYNKTKNINNINIQLYLPNSTQRREIAHIYETYGCECVYDTDFININNEMEPILLKFSQIGSGDILSEVSTDLNLRDILVQIFQNGVKFLNIQHESIKEEYRDITLLKAAVIDFDTENVKQWSKEKWDIYRIKTPKEEVLNTIKGLDKNGLTDEEFNKYKDQLRKDNDDNFLEDITRIIGGRDGGTVIEPKKLPIPIDPQEVEQLKQKLQECQTNIETANREKQELTTLRDTLTAEKTAMEEELRQCKINLENLNQAKNTCDLISARKIKELQDQIKEKQIEIDAAKAGLSASVNRADTLSQQYKTLEAQKTQFENISKLYKAEADKFKNEKELLETQKNDIERQLRECLARPSSASPDVAKQIEQGQRQLRACQNANREQANRFRNQIKELNKKLKDATTQRNDAAIADLNKRIKELEDQNKALEAANAGLEIEKNNERQKLWTELEELRAECGEAVNFDVCGMIKDMAKSSKYDIDLRVRDDGFSGFTDLCFEIATTLKWLRVSQLDATLTEYAQMREVLNLIRDLEKIPIIDKIFDTINHKGWTKYIQFLESKATSSDDKDVQQIISAVRDIKDERVFSTLPMLHSVWDVLDEINYNVFKAKKELEQEVKKDENLNLFFKHAFPGVKIKALYETLFGIKTEYSSIKKRILESPCPGNKVHEVLNFMAALNEEIIHETHPSVIDGVQRLPEVKTQPDGSSWNPFNIYVFLESPSSYITTAKQPEGIDRRYGARLRPKVPYYFWTPPLSSDNYERDRKDNFVVVKMKETEQTDPNDRPWNINTKERKIYFKINSSMSTAVDSVYEARNKAWKNRANIKLPENVTTALNNGTLTRSIAVRNWRLEGGNYIDEQLTINLVECFGEGARDALILLAILDAYKIWLEKGELIDKAYTSVEIVNRDKVDDLAFYTDPLNRGWNVIGENEFIDMRSLLNFVYKYVLDKETPLINTLSTWKDFIKKIQEKK